MNGKEHILNVGPGHVSGDDVVKQLRNFYKIRSGEILCVTIDKKRDNLKLVDYGAIAHKSISQIASKAGEHEYGKIYIFNVIGEFLFSRSKKVIGERQAQVKRALRALSQKLPMDGEIIIGESVTPQCARDVVEFVDELRSDDCDVTIAESEGDIKAALQEFTDEYVEQNFLRRWRALTSALKPTDEHYEEDKKELPFVIKIRKYRG